MPWFALRNPRPTTTRQPFHNANHVYSSSTCRNPESTSCIRARGSLPTLESRSARSIVWSCVTLATESRSNPATLLAINTLPGAPAHFTLAVRPTTETVRRAERFTKSAEMTKTGRRSAGAEPLGEPRSAHHISPRRTTNPTEPSRDATRLCRSRPGRSRLSGKRG
jgi:hypothetical protein